MGEAFAPFIVGIGGTSRAASASERAVVLALEATKNAGAVTRMFGGEFLTRLPLYNPSQPDRTDEERDLLDAYRKADGLIIGTPAYHGGVSGVVKNAIDLIEDTAKDARIYLDGRAVGLIVTAHGWQATGTTLTSMRSIVHALRGWPTPLGAALNSSDGLFGDDGQARDPAVANTLAIIGNQVVQFARWVRRS